MTRRKLSADRTPQVVLPTRIPGAIRELARWAVCSTLGALPACADSHRDSQPGQTVPAAGQGPMVSGPTSFPRGAGASGNPNAAGNTGTDRDPLAAGSTGEASDAGGSRGPDRDASASPSPGWTPIGCDERGLPPLLASARLARVVDYAGLYQQHGNIQTMIGPQPPMISALLERGAACAGATEADAGDEACSTFFERARVPSPRCAAENLCKRVLITTYDDKVTRSEDRATFVALLGAVDEPAKAALLAMYDGFALSCPAPSIVPLRGTETHSVADGFEVQWDHCGAFRHKVHVATDGTLTDLGEVKIGDMPCPIAGRRPAGLLAAGALRAGSRVAALLAQSAHLEAASVFAFERLARELDALRAPDALVAAAACSALDEIRHAHAMAALARRYGGEPEAARVESLPLREPLAIALENAVEGCVREGYGALVAHHQAGTALDPAVRTALCTIAEDETRHATLSWRVAAWLEPRLTAPERRLVAHARADALAQLQRELDPGLSTSEARAIGWPAPELGAHMLARFTRAVVLA